MMATAMRMGLRSRLLLLPRRCCRRRRRRKRREVEEVEEVEVEGEGRRRRRRHAAPHMRSAARRNPSHPAKNHNTVSVQFVSKE
jgi:hypothetical protein